MHISYKNTHNMDKFLTKCVRPMIIIAAAFVLASCAKRETVWIISTNDIHGAIEKVPNLATLVGEYRGQDTASVFLIDAGDRWTGNPYVDMAPEPGRPIIELMNELGYDLATFGNHEFDMGQGILQLRSSEAEFPVILANMYACSSPLSQPKAYMRLKTMRGTNIAVVGLITDFINGHPDGTDEIFEGLEFQSPFETGKEYVWLKENNEVLIALTHIGDDADSVLAVTAPEYDLIIGGHTHTVMTEPRIYGNTYVTQAGSSLKYAGITKLTLRGRKLESIENRLVKLDTVPADSAFAAKVGKYYDNEELRRPIGSFASAADINGVVNLVTDLARREMNTDFALYHIGGIRVHSFDRGPVSKGDMFAIDPFRSTMVKVRMTLPQIREMIINKFNDTANPKESHREDIFPSGMTYTIITDERGEAVDVTFDHRYAYDSGKLYGVAMSDYMYNVYRFDKPEREAVSPLLTDMLIGYFKSSSPVKPDNKSRITIRQR